MIMAIANTLKTFNEKACDGFSRTLKLHYRMLRLLPKAVSKRHISPEYDLLNRLPH